MTPQGELIADAGRGTLTGNRGILHEPGDPPRIVRKYATWRWIACVLKHKDWHREVMEPGRWTHLFFLDDAAALSAGHRPCALCRRPDHLAFTEAWARAQPGFPGGQAPWKRPKVDPIDRVLQAQRHPPRMHAPERVEDLPAGAFVSVNDGGFWVVLPGSERIARWTAGGYVDHTSAPAEPLPLVTTPAMLAVLRAGYAPALHPSAAG